MSPSSTVAVDGCTSKITNDDATEDSSQPSSLLCSSSSTPGAATDGQGGQNIQLLERPKQQQQQQEDAVDAVVSPAACDGDASYFDGEWVSSAVQSAVTHFFGNDNGAAGDNNDEEETGNDGGKPAGVQEEESNFAMPPLVSPAKALPPAKDEPDNDCNATTASISQLKIDTSIDSRGSELAEARSRSYTPSFSLFDTDSGGGCGVRGFYSNLQQCDSNNNDDLDRTLSIENGNSAEDVQNDPILPSPMSDCGSIAPGEFTVQDFHPQTWLAALQSTPTTVRYSAAGAAAALTAVIVIHPLALIGSVAATTAAVSATAVTMWAVGFFHELDRGYQIWSDEFGALFWEDNDKNNDDNNSMGEMLAIAATATKESAEIIEKDEEHLRRVFLLEQERQKLGEKVKVVRVDSGSVREMKDGEALSGAGTREDKQSAADEGRDTISPTTSPSKEKRPPLSTSNKQQPSKKGYGLRRIKSAPVKSKSQSKNRMALQLEKSPSTLPIKPKVAKAKKPQQSMTPVAEQQQSTPAAEPMSSTPKQLPEQPQHAAPAPKPQPAACIDNGRIVAAHFPPLDTCIIRSHDLPGLNSTSQFFDVFFSDGAPYSFRDFQKRRGDVDIVYGQWEGCSSDGLDTKGDVEGKDDMLYSFKRCNGKKDNIEQKPLPPKFTQQRTLKFNTLTKSYFGPAYAKATKVQRATRLSDRILVIENRTQLADIPYSDRFCIVERWVIEIEEEEEVVNQPPPAGEDVVSAPQDGEGMSDGKAHTTTLTSASCKLSVHAEVQLLKPCTWESQIRKKASETFTEVVNEWCKSATVALNATEEQKRKRLRLNPEGGLSSSQRSTSADTRGAAAGPLPPPMPRRPKASTPISARDSELFAKHRRNFQELDKLIAKGDLEWCSVEVMHAANTSDAAFATVLEYPSLNEYEITSSVTGSTEYEDEYGEIDGSRKGSATVIMRRKSRKLFKKLSSRVTSSKYSSRHHHR